MIVSADAISAAPISGPVGIPLVTPPNRVLVVSPNGSGNLAPALTGSQTIALALNGSNTVTPQ